MMKKEKAEGLCPIIFQTDCNDTSTSFCPMTDHQWHTLMDNKDAQRTLAKRLLNLALAVHDKETNCLRTPIWYHLTRPYSARSLHGCCMRRLL